MRLGLRHPSIPPLRHVSPSGNLHPSAHPALQSAYHLLLVVLDVQLAVRAVQPLPLVGSRRSWYARARMNELYRLLMCFLASDGVPTPTASSDVWPAAAPIAHRPLVEFWRIWCVRARINELSRLLMYLPASDGVPTQAVSSDIQPAAAPIAHRPLAESRRSAYVQADLTSSITR